MILEGFLNTVHCHVQSKTFFLFTCSRLRDLSGSPESKMVNCVPIILDRSFPTKDSPARERSVGSVVIR